MWIPSDNKSRCYFMGHFWEQNSSTVPCSVSGCSWRISLQMPEPSPRQRPRLFWLQETLMVMAKLEWKVRLWKIDKIHGLKCTHFGLHLYWGMKNTHEHFGLILSATIFLCKNTLLFSRLYSHLVSVTATEYLGPVWSLVFQSITTVLGLILCVNVPDCQNIQTTQISLNFHFSSGCPALLAIQHFHF